jgi:hypothetical protein
MVMVYSLRKVRLAPGFFLESKQNAGIVRCMEKRISRYRRRSFSPISHKTVRRSARSRSNGLPKPRTRKAGMAHYPIKRAAEGNVP